MKEGNHGITVDDLSEEFKKHPGLLENLTLSIGSVVADGSSTVVLYVDGLGGGGSSQFPKLLLAPTGALYVIIILSFII